MYGSSDQGFCLIVFYTLHSLEFHIEGNPPSPPTCCLISCEVKGVVYHYIHTLFIKRIFLFELGFYVV